MGIPQLVFYHLCLPAVPHLSSRGAREHSAVFYPNTHCPVVSVLLVLCQSVDMKMGVLCCPSLQLLLAALVSLTGICMGGSDGPRGVALPFVFDPKATCDPPCKHAGICIRNNTCFCMRGYEGERCQYGDVSILFIVVDLCCVCGVVSGSIYCE